MIRVSGDEVTIPAGGTRSPGIVYEPSPNLADEKYMALAKQYAIPLLLLAGLIIYGVTRE